MNILKRLSEIALMLLSCALSPIALRLRPFIKNKRGMTGMAIMTVVLVIILTAAVPIGVYITYTLQTVITGLGMTVNSAAANASNAVFTTAWSAYNLMSVLTIIAAAAAIIAILVGAFAFKQGR